MSQAVDHKERAHSVLSASSSSRWLNCTPSARMNDAIPSTSSKHADEGTLAHELSENELRFRLGFIDERTRNLERLMRVRHSLYDTEMEYPIEDYVSFVMEQVAEAKASCHDPLFLIEEKVSVEEYIPDGFGTCDFMAVADGVLYITDLKFGRGVRVSAINNSQLMIYALGALDAYGMLYDIHTVRLTIVQPRLDAISTWDISVDKLLEWGENHVKVKAEIAHKGEGDHTPGDWCKFCKAKAICPALREEALFLAGSDFEEPKTQEDEQDLLEIYNVSDMIIDYLSAVKEHIYESALRGKKWPGLKLVEGRGRRSITDEKEAMRILKADGVSEQLYINTTVKLEGLGNLKKHIGTKRLEELLGHLITKSEGKPTLVDESDRRPEIDRASDFE